MNDSPLVRSFESFTDLNRDFQSLSDLNWPPRNSIGECFAFNQFENEETHADRFRKIINGCNVRVIQRGQDFSLPLKAADAIGVPRELFGKDLDGNFAFQLEVASAVNLTMPPLPNKAVISWEPSSVPMDKVIISHWIIEH